MPVGETTAPQQSLGGQGGAVLVSLKPTTEPDAVILTPSATPAPAVVPAAVAPTPAPVSAPVVTPTPAPAAAIDPNILKSLNDEFNANGEISEATLTALKNNPTLPVGFDQYAATYAMLAKNRREDNRAAAKEMWGANTPAMEQWIASQPALAVAIASAPNIASARLAAQTALSLYAQSNSTAPAVSVTGSGSGGGSIVPSGVPKNAEEKRRLTTDPRFLYDVKFMEKAMAAIDQGMKLGIKYE